MNGALLFTAGATALGIVLVTLGIFLRGTATGRAREPEDLTDASDQDEWTRLLLFARMLWTRITPMFARNYIERQLDAAGYSGRLARNTFIFSQLGVGALLWLVALAVGTAFRNFALALTFVLLAGLVAFVITSSALAARVSVRRSEIRGSLPDMLDLIAVGTEAGQPLNAVLVRTRAAFNDALGEELGRAIRETELGVPRARAVNDMAARTGLPEMQSFAQAIVESQQLGVGLASLLRVQAEDQRRERQLRLQENAARTGLLILLPTAGCIFPALYVIILGPAAISFAHWAGGR
jgi:tight adherence protein C